MGFAMSRKKEVGASNIGRKAGQMFQREYGAEQFAQAEEAARTRRKSDAELAREYAEMMEAIWLERDLLDEAAMPPDRRFFQGDREAWVYERGNVAELVFVK